MYYQTRRIALGVKEFVKEISGKHSSLLGGFV